MPPLYFTRPQVAGVFPSLKTFPIATWLGLPALTAWGWELTPSAGYIGQGMIMGPRTVASMLAGAVVGYGVLGPIARHAGWAPGPIGDWETGAAGWVMWVSLSIMLTDALASLSVLVVQQLRRAPHHDMPPAHHDSPLACQVPTPWWAGGLAASAVVCVALLSPMFALPLYQPAIALALALLVAFVAVRCVVLCGRVCCWVSGSNFCVQLVLAAPCWGRAHLQPNTTVCIYINVCIYTCNQK